MDDLMHDGGIVPAAGRVSILVLDDEQGIVDAMRSLFRRDGYLVHMFTDAREALRMLAATSVDIIISDLRMPHMTGIEFLSSAGGFCPGATRIMVSGYEDREVILNSLARGLARHYVMKPWEDGDLRELIHGIVERLSVPGARDLRTIFGSVESLPPAPQYHHRLTAILAKPDASVATLASEVEKNPSVVAKLLQVANSVYYSARKPVTTVRDAIQFVGTSYIENLVMAIEAFHAAGGCTDPWAAAEVERLWQTSIVRAQTAKTIASRWPSLEDRKVAFVASLLQDIGHVVRVCTDPEASRAFLDLVREGSVGLLEAERRFFGVTHDDVGALLLRYWNVPAVIADAVEHHHDGSRDDLPFILMIADVLTGGWYCTRPPAGSEPVIQEWREIIRSQQLAPGGAV